MLDTSEALKREIQKILDRERWQGYATGKIEGALNVLYQLDLDKQQRIELLRNAVGLSEATATGFIEEEDEKHEDTDERNIFLDIHYHVVDIKSIIHPEESSNADDAEQVT